MGNKIYIVFIDCDSDVDYGVDTATYVAGVYMNEDQANNREKYLKSLVEKSKNSSIDEISDEILDILEICGPEGIANQDITIYVNQYSPGDYLDCIAAATYLE